MTEIPALPENLRAGFRALDGVKEILFLSDWIWYSTVQCWVLHIRLSLPVFVSGGIPSATDWYILASAEYPLGAIKFYPAQAGGIQETFPHQAYNGEGRPELPWRTGDPCLSTAVRVLNRQELDVEPTDSFHRLRWHVERAIEWLQAAASGDLMPDGAPYELPQLPSLAAWPAVIGFSEGPDTLARWQQCSQQVGMVTLGGLRQRPDILYVQSFQTSGGTDILPQEWGVALADPATTLTGAWIRLKRCPILQPWQAPRTWRELRAAFQAQGIDLDKLLRSVLYRLRDGKVHFLFLGFPIPERVGEAGRHMYWYCLKLPVLSYGSRTANGFRNNEKGYWVRDRTQILTDERSLDWVASENWAPAELTSRGRLPESVSQRSVVLIGAGALGSAIAELLLRAGTYRMTLIDEDILKVGNLVRHTLLMPNLHLPKAEALASRLNWASPHARVVGVSAAFPRLSEEAFTHFQEADVIIDCTGSDAVLYALAAVRFSTRKRFLSLSTGLYAQRLFCFAAFGRQFPESAFREQISPWLESERVEYADRPLPREGIGCWHPVFPARADDLWMFAGVAVKWIEGVIVRASEAARLDVFEQSPPDELGFTGLHRACGCRNG